jgi:hypothetical protein
VTPPAERPRRFWRAWHRATNSTWDEQEGWWGLALVFGALAVCALSAMGVL